MTSNLIKFKKYELQYYPCDSTRHQNDNYMITTNENFTNKTDNTTYCTAGCYLHQPKPR
jgi:hypothetical protein